MSPPGQDHNILDELQVTLQELSKAAENIVYMQQTLGSLKQINLRQSYSKMTKLLSSTSALKQFKNINLDEISALLQSPLIRDILTDPEFLQLFTPDTGTTPGTSVPETSLENPEEEQQNKD